MERFLFLMMAERLIWIWEIMSVFLMSLLQRIITSPLGKYTSFSYLLPLVLLAFEFRETSPRLTESGDDEDSGWYASSKKKKANNDVRRFLNRILGIVPEIQNRLFELFVNNLDLLVQKARIEGSLDRGIVHLKANVIELQGTPKTIYVDQMCGASTVLFTFIFDRGVSWELANTMLKEKQKAEFGSSGDGFYKSNSEFMGKRHVILAFESSASAMYKIVRPTTGESPRYVFQLLGLLLV
ncbi:unnamed protein product [Trifolium pratense]|uniref:Uncharacterized protein n=1 Tax=Trifolium pratense TaxID=57577 RepID=A0ACB0JHL3_TRIPR|nr:unnamed protein product [Trifolium pratense]